MQGFRFLTAFCVISLISTVRSEELCSSLPIIAAFKNVTLNSSGAQRRGIELEVGNPAQKFSLWPSIQWNNTVLVESPGFCADDKTPGQCISERGGLYDRARSQSFLSVTKSEWTGANDIAKTSDFSNGFLSYANETVTLPVNSSTMEEYPIALIASSEVPVSVFGLGRNSTILHHLHKTGRIPSTAWGLWVGWTGDLPDTYFDGHVVLGGYDKNKVKGSWFNQTISSSNTKGGCRMGVTVTNMVATLVGGTVVNLFENGFEMDACICPECEQISLPTKVSNRIKSSVLENGAYLGKAVGIYAAGMQLAADKSYLGTITVTLSNGLQVTIPNHQMMHPQREESENGGVVIRNDAVRVMRIYELDNDNSNDLPILGTPFLASTYVRVDPDLNTVSFAEAIGTDQSSVVAIGSPTCESVATTSSPTRSGIPSGSTNTSGSENAKVAPNKSLPAGAIAGIVLGSILLVAGVGMAIFLLRIRRKSKETLQTYRQSNHYFHQFKAELPAEPKQIEPVELSADQLHRSALST